MALTARGHVSGDLGAGVVRRAERLRREIKKGNRRDLATLIACLSGDRADDPVILSTALARATRVLLLSDWNALSTGRGHWRTSSPELRSSLTKLVGQNETTGIYQDLVTAWPDSAVDDARHDRARHREITLLKTFLLYANRAARSRAEFEQLELDQRLELAYPAPIPACWETPPRTVLSIRNGEALLIPNAGYVYGAHKGRGERVRGIDCAGFVCYAVDVSHRLYTRGLELVFRAQRGPAAREAARQLADELGLPGGAQSARELRGLLDDLSAVGRDLRDAAPGDVVVWRWGIGSGRAGHCSIFVRRCTDHRDCFLGIEANRTDDKLQEGVFVRHHSFVVSQKDAYVLRRTDASRVGSEATLGGS